MERSIVNGDSYGTTSRGQMFNYFGPNKERFIEVFTRNNKCWIPNLKTTGENNV